MQSISASSSSVYIKEKKVVSYFKNLLKPNKKDNLNSLDLLEGAKKADLRKDQLFSEIKTMLDDL